MFSHMAYICHFVFYVLPRASYVYIRCGFLPSVVWRFSNIFFQFFRCRNLALNRVFFYFLVVGMFLYLGGGWMPHVCAPPVCLYTPICSYTPHIFVCPQGCTHPPWAPMLSVLLHGFGALYVVGGLFFCFMSIGAHHPYLGVPPPYYPPHSFVGYLCIVILRLSVLMWGPFPSIEGFGGCFPHHLGRFGGHISSLLFTCSFLYIFCSTLCLMSRQRLRLLLLQLLWYLLACHQCQWLLP